MKGFFENLRTSSHKRTWGVLFFALVILSIPLTLNLVNERQDLRQQAASTNQSACTNLPLNECLRYHNICSWDGTTNKCGVKAEQQITSQAAYEISGRVSMTNGPYLEQAIVYLYGPVNKIVTTSNGRYSFNGIPEGNYEVRLKVPDTYKAIDGTCNDSPCMDKTSLNAAIGPSQTSVNFTITQSIY